MALIQTSISTTMDYRFQAGRDLEWYVGVVLNAEGKEIWRSPIARATRAMADLDAHDAAVAIYAADQMELPL